MIPFLTLKISGNAIGLIKVVDIHVEIDGILSLSKDSFFTYMYFFTQSFRPL